MSKYITRKMVREVQEHLCIRNHDLCDYPSKVGVKKLRKIVQDHNARAGSNWSWQVDYIALIGCFATASELKEIALRFGCDLDCTVDMFTSGRGYGVGDNQNFPELIEILERKFK